MKTSTLAMRSTLAILIASVGLSGAYAQSYNSYGGDTWSGAYVGVTGGLSKDDDLNIFRDATLIGGAQFGYRVQVGPGVVGGELQGNYSNGESYATGGGGVLEQYWSGAAKLKAGVALGSTMVFGTGGYGFANLESGSGSTEDAGWAGGWILGGGVEQKLGDALSVSLEYNQMRLDDVSTVTNGVSFSDNLTNHSVKAGLNLQF
ncbi:outer membrane beta-barrel protein (plasmid) [Devosia neptuniae]|uniref:Outer membrane beta-barrel protein n=1 Tax=Devosia neptuniae TaxID=191302 RepID=A0ABY6CCU4_9HYPH|nr:outer membrane beta-barrel protein [Devosia neptuniae]UXN67948.1 outer membrane beta-barrel protein [Devosia neptuniae]UXN76089.1 outer membrane beta-barrel protein [Devosia sp. A8/3-2]